MKRRLGVNIDHIATLRQARKSRYPDPVASLPILLQCGVDQVTVHLREDRRHIQDRDLLELVKSRALPVNMELALADDVIRMALRVKPHTVTFVPEKRAEITTEGGLDVVKYQKKLSQVVSVCKKKSIRTSFFIEANEKQIKASQACGVDAIEFHTGHYAHLLEDQFKKTSAYEWNEKSALGKKIEKSWRALAEGSLLADEYGLEVCAGHGLHTGNLLPLVRIPQIVEYNIGHAIIARSVFVGLENAIQEIQCLLKVST